MPARCSVAITFSGVTLSTCGSRSLRNHWVTSLPMCRASKCSRTRSLGVRVAAIGSLQRRRAADDLGNLLRDLRLAGAVVHARQLLDDVAGVLGGRLHGDAA